MDTLIEQQLIRQLEQLHAVDQTYFGWCISGFLALAGWMIGVMIFQRRFSTYDYVDKKLKERGICDAVKKLQASYEYQFGTEFKSGTLDRTLEQMTKSMDLTMKLIEEVKVALIGDLENKGLVTRINEIERRLEQVEKKK